VQEMAVVLLQRQDNIARNRAEDRALRLARVASGLVPIEEIFADEYTEVIAVAEELAEDAFAQEGVDYDYSGVEWESPEGMDPNDLADLEEFLRNPEITVRAPVDDGGWA
jgi:hypothetical protein